MHHSKRVFEKKIIVKLVKKFFDFIELVKVQIFFTKLSHYIVTSRLNQFHILHLIAQWNIFDIISLSSPCPLKFPK
jgi:hypothetical protein